jgi:hypothetical protein
MANSIINADDGVVSGTAGLKTSGGDDGILKIQTNGTDAIQVNASQQAAFTAGTATAPSITATGDTNTGIYFPAADTIGFTEGGVEAMRIDSSGRVGIGFDAMSVSNTYGAPTLGVGRENFGSLQIESHNNNTAINGSYFGLMRSRGSKASPTHCLSGDVIGDISSQAYHDTGSFPYRTSANIQFIAAANHSSTSLPTNILFLTAATSNIAPTERMRIIAEGRVGIGVTAPTFLLELPNNAADATGRGRANQWATYSDGRIKTDRESLPYGIDAVMQLEPLKYFHHNSTTNEDGNVEILEEGAESIGLVAQDVAAIIPEIVSVPEDLNKDLCSLDYSKLTTVLVKAVQDLKAELDTVKAELETLKGN